MAKVRHILTPIGGGEYSFCGLAFDSFGSGDHETDDDFIDPAPGVRVTCPDCCRAIRLFREAFKGLNLRPHPHD